VTMNEAVVSFILFISFVFSFEWALITTQCL
jgi:uncharacterized iron-regulated protein